MHGSVFLASLILSGSVLQGAVMVGWEAELSTKFHGVSGTVTVLDANTLTFDNFSFDGGGPAVYFYLTNDLGDVESGFILGSLLSGTTYFENDFTLDLDSGRSLLEFNAISVWCADFDVDFGSGEFTAPIPEASTNAMLGSIGVALLLGRRRKGSKVAIERLRNPV